MRFLADENFPLASVDRLREAGHDVLAIIQHAPGAKDAEILAYAVRGGIPIYCLGGTCDELILP